MENKNCGHLEVICGSMFAGKTEELLRRIRRLEYAKKRVAVFKPIIDDRYSKNEVVSHNRNRTISYPIKSSCEIFEKLGSELPDVVCIDEVQFFDKDIIKVVTMLADRGVRVIMAGLDLDFRGEPFGVMPTLLALAEEVTKLTSICPICGGDATRTQRLIDGKPANYNDPIILVGANESYEARCRKHHEVPGKKDE